MRDANHAEKGRESSVGVEGLGAAEIEKEIQKLAQA
jgi:hypothetical protein